jgi:hypothetical protein
MQPLDWIVITLYFAVIGGVAWWYGRHQKDTDDYFLAGRNAGWVVIGASIFTSNIGSEHIVGLAERVLNVPDRIKPMVKASEFERRIQPRLSTGDARLWTDFPHAVSRNRPDDATKTLEKFSRLPVRPVAHTHLKAYDFVLLVPMRVDNVSPPSIPDGQGVQQRYDQMIDHLCRAYTARWHN